MRQSSTIMKSSFCVYAITTFFACEATYHSACRKHFINSPTYWRSPSDINVKKQSVLEESHRAAFQNVVDAVETNMIKNHDIIRLSELRYLYTSGLEGSGFENNDSRADKLKHKLETHPVLEAKLGFTKIQLKSGHFQSLVVYNSDISTQQAIKKTCELALVNPIETVSNGLWQAIFQAYQNAMECDQWPPDPRTMNEDVKYLPPELLEFMSNLLHNKPTPPDMKAERIILSVSQNICRAVTHGKWKLPKHIFLCATEILWMFILWYSSLTF